MSLFRCITAIGCLVSAVIGVLHDPSPAFPVPLWENGAEDLAPAFATLESQLKDLISVDKYDTSSFSIQLTSNTETLWSYSHTARTHNESRPGTKHVDADSVYRIASISKVFTTLGLLYQHKAGNLSLDDPINKHLPNLSGELPWKDITLRALASQLSGLPRDFALLDLITILPDPTVIGLPPTSEDGLPTCDEFGFYGSTCTEAEVARGLRKAKPVFAPNQKSTYSNLNFDLLGFALENVTGLSFKAYMQDSIFTPLNLSSTTLDTPPETHAVIPLGENWFGIDQGFMNPTGGIYSTASDMAKFMRYILTHYNALVTGLNWILPASWGEGTSSFYGMPFEIFRTNAVLKDSKRPVTFVTKSGGVPGYYSQMILMPDYGLGVVILIGGEVGLLSEIREMVTVALARAAEEVIWKDVQKSHAGFYRASGKLPLNSSLSLAASSSTGLVVTSFISNGTDVLDAVIPLRYADDSRSWRAQLVPTLLYKNETAQQGEIWRLVIAYERLDTVWDAFATTDLDAGDYAGLPINEVVFWHEEGVVELPAWKLKLARDDSKIEGKDARETPALVVQE